MDITSGPEPSRLAPTLPLHVVIGLALAVGVAVAGAALQGTVLSIPTWQEKCTNITNMVPIGHNVKIFGHFGEWVHLVFGKFLSLLWLILFAIGLISIV